ncbi:ankyrin repeat protein [Yasminevirus sp. GU-2018]|uniref:Ankyrin repeat protein n=1 Tax=Yasminevirus sp. GU-2018 TaxID=2420051 RepID=A0A5K0U8Y1_9VIRU|nr:ankyrin repeat protein [Yasminevirus sp. GU-2018]
MSDRYIDNSKSSSKPRRSRVLKRTEVDAENSINKLFEYIRNHEWTKFKELLASDDTIDVNVRDAHSNHLLTYAVRFNKVDIVDELLDRGARYDIVDRMERSILYDAIEFSFNDIVVKLLETSEKTIGIMITDIRDLSGNIPLHYAIKFKRPELVKLLLKYKSNPYTTDSEGYNALHLAVRSGSAEITQSIASVMTNVDTKTAKGETSLHIAINYQYNVIAELLLNEGASPNIVDSDNEFSPLHYAVGWNNLPIVKMLLAKGADPNLQDIYGNTPLMYCIKEDYDECFEYISTFFKGKTEPSFKLNISLWNIDGKTPLHEVLENYTENKQHYVDSLIQDTGLSIQDSQGNTCMHYLVALNIWERYVDILKTKKINIFAKNSSGKAVIDLIHPDTSKDKEVQQKYNMFVDIITEGYINILRREKKNWSHELDKMCSRDMSELNTNEKQIVKNNSKKDIDDIDVKNDCFMLIRSKLTGDIKRYREGKLEYCQRSYPTENVQCVDVKEGLMLDVCTFTGSLLDVLLGLMFLLKKHPNACTTLGKDHIPNDDMCNFYRSMGLIMNGRCEFINFEIVWIDYKLYMLDNFSDLFNGCIKSKARFVIIPLGIEMKSGSHANYLIYDKIVKEIERFEPHGGTTPVGFNYNSHHLDEILEEYFKSIDPDITYIRPQDYIPKIGFQLMDSQEDRQKRIGDPGGFCALWSIWYVDQRLTYHTYSRKELVGALFENIKSQGISYRNMIRNYSRNIITERDRLLKMIDIDINDWLNDNYTYTQLDKFISILTSEINTCCTVKR